MKKTLSKFFLGVLLAIPVVFAITPSNEAEAAGGTGTFADPYLISTSTEFLTIQNNASAHYKLTNDINMLAVPFNGFGAGNTTWFTGSLDGNGFTVRNMTIDASTGNYRGMFGSIYESGDAIFTGVKNLKIDNATLNGGVGYLGIVAGRMTSANNTYRATIDNVTITNSKVIPNVSANSYVGGMIGEASNFTTLKDITTDIYIDMRNNTYGTTFNYLGGVVGFSQYVNMTNVKAYGKIDFTKTNSYDIAYVGGVSGYSMYSDWVNLENHVDINVTGNASVNQVGGIFGYHRYGILDGAINYGNITVTGTGERYQIGGIVGYLHYQNNNTTYRTNDVTNIGDISVTTTSGNAYNIGGIFGYAYYSNYLTKLLNTGNIAINASAAIYNIGGATGYYYPYSSSGTSSDWASNADISITGPTVSVNAYTIGGLIGSYQAQTTTYLNDVYSSGNLGISTNKAAYYVGGLIGAASGSPSYQTINKAYTDVNLDIKNIFTGSTQYYPAGLIGNAYTNISNSLALGSITAANYYNDFSLYSGTPLNIRKISTLNSVNNTNATNITVAQSTQWATYSGLTWSNSVWGIKEGQDLPYLNSLTNVLHGTTKPTADQSFQVLNIPFEWNDQAVRQSSSYSIVVEKQPFGLSTWSPVGTFTSATTSYTFIIPNGTAGNTKFRYKVASVNGSGTVGPYTNFVEFLFSNNTTTVAGTFMASQKDLAVSLDKRVMPFTISGVVDPDAFNYVKLYAELVGVAGSKKQLGANLTGPVAWSSKNYKLKLEPIFSPTGSTFDVKVVDAANENIVYATLVTGRSMQLASAPSPESFTLKIYAEDYQNTNNTQLSTSNMIQQAVTFDTRNYLPRAFNINHDVNGRVMSSNQGFNKIKFSGSVDDLDPNDGITLYYAVKLQSDKIAGKYVVNPASDIVVKTFVANPAGTGTTGTYEATYTITESLANGDYALLVYGKDTQNGIGNPVEINFTINKTNPDIRFYANYNGTVVATPERHIQAKDSKLKMYFSAYDYTTFEYAGYVVRANQQTNSGSYEDLKIRGAFTNDVPSQFIGVDLADVFFNKGDMIVFKYRAISSTGVKIEKDVRVLIGDQNNTLADVADTKVPTPLLIN